MCMLVVNTDVSLYKQVEIMDANSYKRFALTNSRPVILDNNEILFLLHIIKIFLKDIYFTFCNKQY